MEEGEVDCSNQQVLPSPNNNNNMAQLPIPMDSYFEELLLKDTHACTHTHTRNPPSPEYSHTHTCYHVHTKILPAPAPALTSDEDESAEKRFPMKKRPTGNREAVRKYREKKKARAASPEDEVVKLRALNQHLVKRLQGQAALEAEIARLKCFLVDSGEGLKPRLDPSPITITITNLLIQTCLLLLSPILVTCSVTITSIAFVQVQMERLQNVHL